MLTATRDTAVVILSYNGRQWHEKFLPGILAEAGSDYEVIVVDNASTDDTPQYLATHFPQVQTLTIAVNRGFAAGYAEGLRQISADYYVLLSADFEVTPGWFPPLRAAFERYPQLGAVQPKIRYWRERTQFEYAGAAGGFMDALGYLFCRGRMFDTLETDAGQYDDDVEVFWASGGCLMVRTDAYHAAGGLDDALYAHMEEVDLCWRLQRMGYRIGAIGSSTVFHVGGSVISYGSPQKLYYNFRNNLLLLLKNERRSKLLWLLPTRLVLDGVAGVKYLLGGHFKEVGVILRAHMGFYGMARATWKKRMLFEAGLSREVLPAGRYTGAVIWQYFIKRIQTFSALPFRSRPL
ncbi:MAG: glycosyltransferase family 2 protein [Sphingobacteriales bacterium]|nr:MAG: glycosyltransferase family 2 protein [Sphingobacteriales bacterium]